MEPINLTNSLAEMLSSKYILTENSYIPLIVCITETQNYNKEVYDNLVNIVTNTLNKDKDDICNSILKELEKVGMKMIKEKGLDRLIRNYVQI